MFHATRTYLIVWFYGKVHNYLSIRDRRVWEYQYRAIIPVAWIFFRGPMEPDKYFFFLARTMKNVETNSMTLHVMSCTAVKRYKFVNSQEIKWSKVVEYRMLGFYRRSKLISNSLSSLVLLELSTMYMTVLSYYCWCFNFLTKRGFSGTNLS